MRWPRSSLASTYIFQELHEAGILVSTSEILYVYGLNVPGSLLMLFYTCKISKISRNVVRRIFKTRTCKWRRRDLKFSSHYCVICKFQPNALNGETNALPVNRIIVKHYLGHCFKSRSEGIGKRVTILVYVISSLSAAIITIYLQQNAFLWQLCYWMEVVVQRRVF